MKYTAMAILFVALAAGGCDEGDGGGKDAAASKDGENPSSAAKDDKDEAPKPSGLDGKEVVALAEGYAKAVCECENAQCINKAGDKYHQDTNKLYEDGKVRNPTPEQKKKMDAAQAKVGECTDKVLGK